MKFKKCSLIATILIFAILFCGCSSGKQQQISATFEPEPITSESDKLLRYNPDRAWRGEAYVNISNVSDDGETVQSDPTVNVRRFVSKYEEYTPQLCQVYFYLTGYKNLPTIPQIGLDRIQQVFDCAEELGIKLVVRFAYQNNMQGTGEAEDNIMLAHMNQLKPILEKNKKLIHVVEAGFLGAWGEWHSYRHNHDQEKLLRGIIDMVPESLFIQVRYPGIKNLIPATDKDYSRLGFHDDSFFGYRYCKDAATLNPGEDDWNQVIEESPYVPVGGETFWGSETDEEIDGYDAILQYSAFRQNSFSIYHCFIEDGYDKGYPIEQWQKEEIVPEWLEKNNLFYAKGWFFDKDGNQVKRTVFDYVCDYLGYKLEIRKVGIDGVIKPEGELDLRVELVNYGFSAAFQLNSGFAILDENNKVVTEVEAGTPASWNSRSPRDYNNSALLTHKVLSKIKLPKKSGKYKVAMYLKNSTEKGVRFGNNLPYENGYTVLYELEF